MQEHKNATEMTLAERLKLCRGERGWSQSELRRRAGLSSPSTISELESGKISKSPQLGQIAAAMGIESMWLQFGEGPKYKGDDPIISMGTIALDAARIIDSMPDQLQVKALHHVTMMKEIDELEDKISAKKPVKATAVDDLDLPPQLL